MLYVIGDIHGMYDMFSKFIRNTNIEKHDKLIFLGDYIDYGPSSKEVIDLLMELDKKFSCIFLLGNHEYMFLDYLHHGPLSRNYNTHTWLLENGGINTIISFDIDKSKYPNLYTLKDNISKYSTPIFDTEIIDKKYIDFLLNLKTYHMETVFGYQFLFTHAPFYYFDDTFKKPQGHFEKSADEILNIQLQYKNYTDISNAYDNNELYGEENNLWNRSSFKKIKNFIMISGHNPTCHLEENQPELVKNSKYDIHSLLPFIVTSNNSIIYDYYNDSISVYDTLENISMIDIDTGARYGNYLTVLQLDDKLLNENIWKKSLTDKSIKFRSCKNIIKAFQYWPYESNLSFFGIGNDIRSINIYFGLNS